MILNDTPTTTDSSTERPKTKAKFGRCYVSRRSFINQVCVLFDITSDTVPSDVLSDPVRGTVILIPRIVDYPSSNVNYLYLGVICASREQSLFSFQIQTLKWQIKRSG